MNLVLPTPPLPGATGGGGGAARARANREQLEASDPGASAFVAANAGSGKTRVLTDRLLRLLLAGANPARIQCLTFTKAAAAEMAVRLQRTLGEWVTLSDDKLDERLRALDVAPDAEKRGLARALFARVLDLPGGMRIGTIHAFCQSLLRRFPLEAELSPQFRMLEDTEARATLDRVREDVLAATPGLVGPLPGMLRAEDFAGLVADLLGAGGKAAGLRGLPAPAQAAAIARALNLAATAEQEVVAAASAPWSGEDVVRDALRLVAEEGSDAAKARAHGLLDWLALAPAARAGTWQDWAEGWLTNAGAPRALSAYAGKKLAEKHPRIEEAVRAEQARVLQVEDQRRAAREAELTAGLLQAADRVLEAYVLAKRRAGVLDFADLIARADRLLRDPGAAWVLYKLDGGMDHLLLDEVQDTAPEQWRIAHTLTEEFFAGLGAADADRTFFAVGDLKQSIYSFQGADPAEFERSREEMRRRVQDAGKPWRDVALDVSFRSTAPVLALVDAVFADGPARAGVAAPGMRVEHFTDRADQAGRVELWPLAPAPEKPVHEPWTVPERNENLVSAPQRLADGIASWLAEQFRDEVPLASHDRPLQPGDVLVLVRTRNAFARSLVRALKAKGVPVAGLDRLALLEQAAVQDVLALCDALLLPEDDLQLACVLTSPLGGLSDESLMRLAMDRHGTLWDALQARAKERGVWGRAWEFLSALRARADYVTPHALLSEALGPLGGRARLFRRLGPEAAEPVDELLGAALRYASVHPPNLQGFVHWLRRQAAEVKREAEPAGGGAVRVMTVHGAKGLEAPVVILPDTTTGFGKEERLAWLPDPRSGKLVPVWSPVRPQRSPRVRAAYDEAARLRQAELNRLLYVALTRAEDRLVVCGWETNKPQPDCWYELVRHGFERLPGVQAEPLDLAGGGWGGDRIAFGQAQRGQPVQRHAPPPPPRGAALPDWAGQAPEWRPHPPPQEPPVPQPLAPSRPEGIELGDLPGVRSPLAEPDAARFLRGKVAHQLLQHLPELPEGERARAAHLFAAQPGLGLGAERGAAVADQVLAVLGDPELAPLFGPGSRAEQPLTGLVGGNAVIRGVVDRLVVLDDAVLVADYKTNRDPPRDAGATPVAYRRQMAAYRAVLRGIYPGKPVRCALVWTEGCRVVFLPDALLDEHAPGQAP